MVNKTTATYIPVTANFQKHADVEEVFRLVGAKAYDTRTGWQGHPIYMSNNCITIEYMEDFKGKRVVLLTKNPRADRVNHWEKSKYNFMHITGYEILDANGRMPEFRIVQESFPLRPQRVIIVQEATPVHGLMFHRPNVALVRRMLNIRAKNLRTLST